MNKRILLIRLSSLGDIIHTIPLANSLKAAGYSITWLVSEKGYQILEGNPCVDEVILVPIQVWKKRGCSFESFKEYLKILKHIRDEHFDIAIDTQMMLKTLYWMLFCGAKRRIVSVQAREFSILGGNEFIPRITKDYNTPVIRSYMKFGDYLGVNTEKIVVTLPKRSQETVEKIDKLLESLDKSKPLVVISPATTWVAKHWNRHNWRILIKDLKDRCNVVFTGGKGDMELINYINTYNLLNLAGQTDLLELVEVFSRADVVISPDSGSAHLAWATQKPSVVTIFTCTPPTCLAPVGEKNVAVIGDLPCQPCFKHKCPLGENQCTILPKPKEIISIVNKLLSEKDK